MKRKLQISGYILTVVSTIISAVPLIISQATLFGAVDDSAKTLFQAISLSTLLLVAISCGLSIVPLKFLKPSKRQNLSIFNFSIFKLSNFLKHEAVIIVILNFCAMGSMIAYLYFFAVVWSLIICTISMLALLAGTILLIISLVMKGPFLEPSTVSASKAQNVLPVSQKTERKQKLERQIAKLDELKSNNTISEEEYSNLKQKYIDEYVDEK